MDYSLLVGIDMNTKVHRSRSVCIGAAVVADVFVCYWGCAGWQELVVGIIDFIRTFTWDKRLEMYVKSSGFLGGSGNLPTVVSPSLWQLFLFFSWELRFVYVFGVVWGVFPLEAYRSRFLDAMGNYFHLVPDQWTYLSTFMSFEHSQTEGTYSLANKDPPTNVSTGATSTAAAATSVNFLASAANTPGLSNAGLSGVSSPGLPSVS
jgi:hypothetical protein